MAVTTNNFKNGMCIMYDNKMWIIVDFQHVKPGKGGAFVRTKLKELKSGRVVDITFRAGEKLDDVRVETKRMQYLYNDGTNYNFMDTSSYEQIELAPDFVGEQSKWLRENDEVEMIVAGGEFIGVEPPMFVELEVTETDPGFKGDTVQGGTKPATLETGAVVQVPMFINTGERVKIDTRDGRYITRV
ncbi:MAG: elongation factor [Actinobacteria bacterium]|jgi:elongation factor P|nr:MAG: elongation factor [Actinomycetota bacterium]MDO8949337.1 elongation factor P [Actinomycetota bacterium]